MPEILNVHAPVEIGRVDKQGFNFAVSSFCHKAGKFLLSFAILIMLQNITCYILPSFADDPMPDQATLSANRMRFDAQTGDFLADGNVVITAGDLKVNAPVGSGNIDRREVNFDQGITASGKWYGDKINLYSGRLLLSFTDIPTCKFQNIVKGSIGTMKLDADRLTITGAGGVSEPTRTDRQTKFWIVKARNLEDSLRGLSFGADNVEGIIRAGDLYELTAKKNVWLKGKPKAKGDAVSLKGDNALYSLERGSVVVSGHVTAIQGGRTLKSDSIVYFPEQNRVEAIGGMTRNNSNGTVSSDRAEITIDLTRERQNKNNSSQPQIIQQDTKQNEQPQTLKIDTKPKTQQQTKSSTKSSSSSRKTRKK